MTGINMTTQLTEIEFKSTYTDKMIDVTETAEPVVDIWPYVQQLMVNKIVHKYTFENTLVEKVYRNQTNTFEQVLLPSPNKNIFIVIIIDLINIKIKGHYQLNLNEEYNL